MKILVLLLTLCLSLMASAAGPNLLNTQRISFIHVGPSKGLSESSFGHVALRLSPTLKPGFLDMVVEFVADVPENESAIKKYVKGMGLFKRYPVVANVSPFIDFKKLKTINEDRPLEIYELDLKPEEVKAVVQFILDFQNKVTEDSYTFFKKNCSYFSSHAIEVATGRFLKRKSFPWVGPKELAKHNLVVDHDSYPAATSERVRYAQKFLKEGLGGAFPDISWTNTFVESLKSMALPFRLSAYMKLLWVLSNEGSKESDKKQASGLFRYLVSQETDAVAFVLKSMFKDPEQKKIFVTRAVDFNREDVNLPPKKWLEHGFLADKGKLWLHMHWNEGDVKYPISQLLHDQASGLITYQGKNVGRSVPVKKGPWLLSQGLDYGVDFDEKHNTLRGFVYVDNSTNLSPLTRTYQEHRALSHIGINNARDFAGEVGSCYAMTLLQKALMERAIFLPDVTPVQSLDHLSVLKALMDGQFVAIPGFKNIADFTAAIDKEALKTFIRSKQAALTKGAFATIIENLTKRAVIDKKGFPTFRSLVEEGFLVPMIITMVKKGTTKVATNYAHAVLVMGIEELPEGKWKLTAYDPNTNINSLFILDKDYRLSYPFYDKKFDYIGILDSLNEDDLALDQAVRTRAVNTGILAQQAKHQGAVIISPKEITKILR